MSATKIWVLGGLLALVMGPGFSGCLATQKVDFIAEVPAQVDLPEGLRTVVLVDRSAPRYGQRFYVDQTFDTTKYRYRMEDWAVQELLQSLKAGIQRSGAYEVVIAGRPMYRQAEAGRPSPLHFESIDSLCLSHAADAAIVLENFDTDLFSGHLIDRGSDQYRLTEVWLSLRFYHGVTGKLIGQYEEHPLLEREVRVRLKEFGQRREDIVDWAGEQGQRLAKWAAPYSTWLRRRWYPSGSAALRTIAQTAEAGQWEVARQAWRALADSSHNLRERQLAGLNIAVASELLGDLHGAIQAARFAVDSLGDGRARARKYLEDLLARQP